MRKDSFWRPLVQNWAVRAIAATAVYAANVTGGWVHAQDASEEAPAEDAEEEEEEEPEEQGLLMQALCPTRFGQFLMCNNTKIYGNVAQGIVCNFDSPADRFNGPMTWMDRDKEWGVQQAWLGASKTLVQDDCCWDWGYQVDAMYGTNARFNTAQGFENQINNGRSFYGMAMPNLNLKAGNQDWTFTVGRFTSPIGYFTVDTTQNFFPILPYTYQYGEPFTHTGATAAYKVNDRVTATGGITRGWDNWDGTGFGAPSVGALGMVSIAGECEGDSLTWFGHWSREPNETTTATNNAFSGRYVQSLVYIRKLSENATWVLQSDFGHQAAAKANGASASWYGVNQYWFYKYNDCWTWGTNLEWFRDDGGFRVGTLLPAFPGSEFRGLGTVGGLRNGYNGHFFRFMAGPQWSPRTNLVIRPALTLDVFAGSIDAAKQGVAPAAVLRPFNDGNSNVQGTALVDFFIRY